MENRNLEEINECPLKGQMGQSNLWRSLSIEEKIERLKFMKAEGYTNKEIGDYYNVSEDGVRMFIKRNMSENRTRRTLDEIHKNPYLVDVDKLQNLDSVSAKNINVESAKIDYITSDAKYVLFEIDDDGKESSIPIIIKDREALVQTYKDKGITIYERFIDNLDDNLRTKEFMKYKCFKISNPLSKQIKNDSTKKDIEFLKSAFVLMFESIENSIEDLNLLNRLRAYIKEL